ncbi:leukotriene A-4 hydrolase-like [Mya arenaria]|uniref:leukotriene A-4 hydrolase-like n=1 Tax=Mya arenaria TaxID=6604 RepID=UPI0022E38056|nr:leukotriene A-4 hydrolase-like [Mya arenaria]
MSALSSRDPSSFSNPDEIRMEHIHLNLTINFDKHTLSGHAQLTFVREKPEAEYIILDTRELTITSVRDVGSNEDLEYELAEHVVTFGSKLTVKLNDKEPEHTIEIEYETSPECSALHWIRPDQTLGKKHPYLFSQCQAIHCRSVVPCQDTPSIKCTYTANIRSPPGIKVLMSALLEESEKTEEGHSVSMFRQSEMMPSCLLAIVAGDIVSREIGPRSKIWAEREILDRAAYEFAETEDMLQVAEELLGPYVWGRYDMIVLPPSFPYGGMENPCRTFVTPTLLAGDRSLADVIAHEIAHSWTGNLVTCKTWAHFWLNESYTEFSERKIVSDLKGGEKFRQFLALRGWKILCETVDELGEDSEFTKLVPNMDGVDPDESFSSIPYEKGHALLFYLEQLLGGPDVFEPYVRAYIDEFKYKSITTQDWKDFLFNYFKKEVAEGKLDGVDWEGWLYKKGVPPQKPNYDTTMMEECVELMNRWLNASDDNLKQFKFSNIADFHSLETEQFLSGFADHDPISHKKLVRMGDVYKFKRTGNSEIKFRWLKLCIQARYEPAISEALKFVTDQGRMKFVQPIYTDLYDWEVSRQRAIDNFLAHRQEMHNITVIKLERDLGLEEN